MSKRTALEVWLDPEGKRIKPQPIIDDFPAWLITFLCVALGCIRPVLEAVYCTTFINPNLFDILEPDRLWDQIEQDPAWDRKYQTEWWNLVIRMITPRLRKMFPGWSPFRELRSWFKCPEDCTNKSRKKYLFPMKIGTDGLPPLDWIVQCASCHRRLAMQAFDETKRYVYFDYQGETAISSAHAILENLPELWMDYDEFGWSTTLANEEQEWTLMTDTNPSLLLCVGNADQEKANYLIGAESKILGLGSVCRFLKIPNVIDLPRVRRKLE